MAHYRIAETDDGEWFILDGQCVVESGPLSTDREYVQERCDELNEQLERLLSKEA